MKQTLETLKSYFQTGDKPTQEEYENLLDSLVHVSQVPVPIYTVEASSSYASVSYNPIFPFLNQPKNIASFSGAHWLSASGVVTNQRLCIYFSNPCSISKFTYLNGGQSSVSKGGIKTCKMYGMTSRMAYDTTHGTIVPEMTDALYSGDFEQYTENQFNQGGISVEITKTPMIYGIILDIDDKYAQDGYMSLKSLRFFQ